jgi:hypothetical protein
MFTVNLIFKLKLWEKPRKNEKKLFFMKLSKEFMVNPKFVEKRSQ